MDLLFVFRSHCRHIGPVLKRFLFLSPSSGTLFTVNLCETPFLAALPTWCQLTQLARCTASSLCVCVRVCVVTSSAVGSRCLPFLQPLPSPPFFSLTLFQQ